MVFYGVFCHWDCLRGLHLKADHVFTTKADCILENLLNEAKHSFLSSYTVKCKCVGTVTQFVCCFDSVLLLIAFKLNKRI